MGVETRWEREQEDEEVQVRTGESVGTGRQGDENTWDKENMVGEGTGGRGGTGEPQVR